MWTQHELVSGRLFLLRCTALKFVRPSILLLVWVAFAGITSAADVVVVRPAAWAFALEDWKEHRQSQGFQIVEVDSSIGRSEIRRAIETVASDSNGQLRFVLLAGDVAGRELPATDVPTFHHASTAMVRFGGEPMLASDNDYGDLDGDHSPDLAVGRIPADSAEQLKSALARVIAYEKQNDFATWRRNVHVVAGVGGFGALTDSVIEMTTRRFLADRIPGWSALTMTQASLQSHYCPDPHQFSDTCIGRMNEGGMFWVYIGHGHVNTLDYLKAGDKFLPIMTNDDVPAINTTGRAPIAVFLACYTGAFDALEDSLAEKLVLSEAGPIAAIAASRVSGPYGLAMLSDGMLASCFDQQTETLGEVVMQAKQNLLDDSRFDKAESATSQLGMINAIADALTPADYDLRAERLEHVWQVNLLGDPMLKLSHPTNLALSAKELVYPGEVVTVSGTSKSAGKLTLELARCRGQVSENVKLMHVGLGDDESNDYQSRYLAANQCIVVAEELLCPAGPFSLNITIPPDLPRGKYCLRMFHEGDGGWQVGYQEIKARPQATIQPALE